MLLVVQVTTGNIVYREVKLGGALDLRGARNVLIHPGVEIGDRCRIGSGVTMGTNGRFKEGAPKVGNDVIIEHGVKILGPVTIGDGVVIRANSLVLTDVPAGAVAMGVPARYARPRPVRDALDKPAAALAEPPPPSTPPRATGGG
jgi:serine O-acetyltransferase